MLLVLILPSCDEEPIVWHTVETEYFFFDRPEDLRYPFINEDPSNYNRQRAIEAVALDSLFPASREGRLKFKKFTIHFILNSNDSSSWSPSPCSDKELFIYGGNHDTGAHKVRVVTKKDPNNGNYFVNACFDGEHRFFVNKVGVEDLALVKQILLKVRVKG